MSTDDIAKKVADGRLVTAEKDSTKNSLWKSFLRILDGDNVLPYVQCQRCKKVLSHDKRKGGTSHLHRHATSCSPSSQATPISSYFKMPCVPASVKSEITVKYAECVCRDIRPFETIAGEGFASLAQAFISIGVKYGMVSAKDVIPNPTTVSRKTAEVADSVRNETAKPQVLECLNNWGGGVTTDMWTEMFTQTSYITVTIHYVDQDWKLMECVLATRSLDVDQRHTALTAANVKQAVDDILTEFDVDMNKIVFITDRGANMLCAMKDCKHVSCCDHMINTVLTHVFDNNNLHDCPQIYSLITASKELVRYFKKSGLMKHLKTTLKQEVATRWNMMYFLLESILDNFEQIEHILRTRSESYRLLAIEKTNLKELVDFLEVFKVASVELESTKKPTMHLVLPWYHKIMQHCKTDRADSVDLSALKCKATSLLIQKFKLEPLHQVAAVLNPKTRNLKMPPQEEKQRVYEVLRAMLSHVTQAQGQNSACKFLFLHWTQS